MSKIKDVIVYLDRVARERGIELQERAVNKRSFERGPFRFEYAANGSMIKLKTYEDGDLKEIQNVDPERVVEIWDNILDHPELYQS